MCSIFYFIEQEYQYENDDTSDDEKDERACKLISLILILYYNSPNVVI